MDSSESDNIRRPRPNRLKECSPESALLVDFGVQYRVSASSSIVNRHRHMLHCPTRPTSARADIYTKLIGYCSIRPTNSTVVTELCSCVVKITLLFNSSVFPGVIG